MAAQATQTRAIVHRFAGQPTLEGAGVRLRRQFGYHEVPLLDPFLLLDNFGSDKPADYVKGFPWHPHRGMETVTYMLEGRTDHEDTLGNKGTIGPGEVQWMSAGSGILHQEMPQPSKTRLSGLQLWINLPAKGKMQTPAYRGVGANDVPVVKGDDGSTVKVIAGTHGGATGPVAGISVEPVYLDVSLPAGVEFRHATPPTHNVFAHVIAGRGCFDPTGVPSVGHGDGPVYVDPHTGNEESTAVVGETIHYGPGGEVRVKAGEGGVRFVLASGKPLGEPVAWHGPIVMNTREEILRAMSDLRDGTFIRAKQVLGA
jgi:redox-sensitive bicupin YhaK (pirin superfamily)